MPSAITKPTIVLVHGAWQSPAVWSHLTPLLEEAGYSVCPVKLASQTAPASPDFDDDVKIVRRAIDAIADTGKDMVLVCHSYGGVVGCEALKAFHGEMATNISTATVVNGVQTNGTSCNGSTAKGKTRIQTEASSSMSISRGKVLHVAFLAAMLVQEGSAMWRPAKDTLPGFSREGDWLHMTDGETRMYNDLPADAARKWAAKLTSQSRGAILSKLTYPAYHHFPTSYLLCTRDTAIPPRVQERMALTAGILPKNIIRVDAGHSPMVSQPAKVAAFIRKAAGEWSGDD